jgi:hypothetical protein
MDIRDPKARSSVAIDFAAMKDSRIGELAARLAIVLGFTPGRELREGKTQSA